MILSHFILLLGSCFFIISALGLFRMPDSFSRVHAATKASSLGVILCSLAAAIEFQSAFAILSSLAIVLLVFLTAPMGCHTISERLLPPKDGAQSEKEK